MAAGSTFNVGDIVKLKSGEPDMTVRIVPNQMKETYDYQWFAGKKLEQGSLPGDSLESVKAKEN